MVTTDRQLLERLARHLEEALTDVRALLDHDTADETLRLGRLLMAVQEKGAVSPEELRVLAERVGYPTRGLGGFFRSENSSLRREDDGTVVLTDAGEETLDRETDAKPALGDLRRRYRYCARCRDELPPSDAIRPYYVCGKEHDPVSESAYQYCTVCGVHWEEPSRAYVCDDCLVRR